MFDIDLISARARKNPHPIPLKSVTKHLKTIFIIYSSETSKPYCIWHTNKTTSAAHFIPMKLPKPKKNHSIKPFRTQNHRTGDATEDKSNVARRQFKWWHTQNPTNASDKQQQSQKNSLSACNKNVPRLRTVNQKNNAWEAGIIIMHTHMHTDTTTADCNTALFYSEAYACQYCEGRMTKQSRSLPERIWYVFSSISSAAFFSATLFAAQHVQRASNVYTNTDICLFTCCLSAADAAAALVRTLPAHNHMLANINHTATTTIMMTPTVCVSCVCSTAATV